MAADLLVDIAADEQVLAIGSGNVYQQVGGHAAVADTILEDVALAQGVKRAGGRLRFRFGGDAVRTRMYRSFGELREGWTKNLALLFPDALTLALRRALEFVGISGGFALTAWSLVQERPASWYFAGAALILLVLFLRRISRAHMPAVNTALSVLGLPIFSYLLLRSYIHYRGGRPITWKGRSYSTPRTSPARTSAMPEATRH
jgi:hypothetical protein